MKLGDVLFDRFSRKGIPEEAGRYLRKHMDGSFCKYSIGRWVNEGMGWTDCYNHEVVAFMTFDEMMALLNSSVRIDLVDQPRPPVAGPQLIGWGVIE